MTLSAYFMSKSVFDQQDCRALTFALARLSCFPKASWTSPALTCYSWLRT